MNPPYIRNLGTKFLDHYISMADYLVTLQPFSFHTDRSPSAVYRTPKLENAIRSRCSRVHLINASTEWPDCDFHTAIHLVTFFPKNDGFYTIINDLLPEIVEKIDSSFTIGHFAMSTTYHTLADKIRLFPGPTCANHLCCVHDPNNDTFMFGCPSIDNINFVRWAKLRGHTNDPEHFYRPDFWTIVTSDCKSFTTGSELYEKYKNKLKDNNWVGFLNENEANNFITYLKNKIVRFCILINKTGITFYNSKWNLVPWYNFSESIETKKLIEDLDLTKDDCLYIDHIVANWYSEDPSFKNEIESYFS